MNSKPFTKFHRSLEEAEEDVRELEYMYELLKELSSLIEKTTSLKDLEDLSPRKDVLLSEGKQYIEHLQKVCTCQFLSTHHTFHELREMIEKIPDSYYRKGTSILAQRRQENQSRVLKTQALSFSQRLAAKLIQESITLNQPSKTDSINCSNKSPLKARERFEGILSEVPLETLIEEITEA